MDSDDIMMPNRLNLQYDYLMANPDVKLCGGQLLMFRENINNIVNITNHRSINWEEYLKSKYKWIANHPTLAYRKHAVLEVGNYNNELTAIEDLELELKLLKHYNYLHNLGENLCYYRLHDEQTTIKYINTLEWQLNLNKIIENQTSL